MTALWSSALLSPLSSQDAKQRIARAGAEKLLGGKLAQTVLPALPLGAVMSELVPSRDICIEFIISMGFSLTEV